MNPFLPGFRALAVLFALSACGAPVEMDGERAYRQEYGLFSDKSKEARSGCEVARSCGDFDFIDCGQEVDGPTYFVHRASQQILEICGGACSFGSSPNACVACPPPEWTCQWRKT